MFALMIAHLYGCARRAGTGRLYRGWAPGRQPVPSFAVSRLEGGTGFLRAYRGHAIVANVWATWCPPCRCEMPALQKLSRAYAPRGLVVVGLDQGEADDVVRRFMRSMGVTYPILIDRDQRYGQSFMVPGLPTTVFVRPDGTVATVVYGEMSYALMVQHSEALLARSARHKPS